MSTNLSPIHYPHEDGLNSPYVPAISCVSSGELVVISGLTAAPPYHVHPHAPEVFDSLPLDVEAQMAQLLRNLDDCLDAADCTRAGVVNMLRFFTHVADDQDTVNAMLADWFGGHVPTSTSVEVSRLATDPRLRIEIQTMAVR